MDRDYSGLALLAVPLSILAAIVFWLTPVPLLIYAYFVESPPPGFSILYAEVVREDYSMLTSSPP